MFAKLMRTTKKFSLSMLALAALTQGAWATVIYDSIPTSEPPNLPSLGYEATATTEFGDNIKFAGTDRNVGTVTVAMSNWAKLSDYPDYLPLLQGYNHEMTLSLYNVDKTGTTPKVGSLIDKRNASPLIPWRPESLPGQNPGKYTAADGKEYGGILFYADFDFLGVTVPDEIIFGLSFNTADYGTPKTGEPGPYNSLNFGLSGGTTVGTDANPDAVFWNTSHAGFYTDGGAAGVGTFRQDTNWTPYVPAIRFEATAPVVPEPATLSLLGLGLAGLGVIKRRRATRA